jgi:hypothetical protein
MACVSTPQDTADINLLDPDGASPLLVAIMKAN